MEKTQIHNVPVDVFLPLLKFSAESTYVHALCPEYLWLTFHELPTGKKAFNARLITNFDESRGTISLILHDINRMILNLLINLLSTCNKQKESQVSEEDYESGVAVSAQNTVKFIDSSVKDSGRGVPKAGIAKIFHPFFAIASIRLGIGLELSKRCEIITAGLNGKFIIESKEN